MSPRGGTRARQAIRTRIHAPGSLADAIGGASLSGTSGGVEPLRPPARMGSPSGTEATPSAGLALEAGRASESGGDIGAALEYYVKALDNGHASGGAEQKGSLRWHEDDLPRPSRSLS